MDEVTRRSSGRASRAGRRLPRPEGYHTFLPKALPPDPPLRFDAPLRAMLSKADQGLGRLDGSIQILPDPELFLLTYMRQEAVLSSQIEGTQSSLEDVLAADAKIYSPDQPADTHEVINYVAAMREGLEAIGSEPIASRSRSRSSAGCTASSSPRPGARPSTRAICAHPFRDGNGRIGRLLITLLLCRERILTKPVLYLSWFFKRHRADYYDRLQRVRTDGDWEGWILFFLRAACEVSASAVTTTRRILSLRERHRIVITERFGRTTGSGHRMLESLFRQPFLTVSSVRRTTGTSYTAANALVGRLVEAGILEERTGHRRNRVFAYGPYLRLFAAGPDPDEPPS